MRIHPHSKSSSTQQVLAAASAFRLLSDPTRLVIICKLKQEPEGMCVYEIADAVGISHSAASHQLSKLEAHSLVSSYREGQSVCYRLNKNEKVKSLLLVLKSAHLS